MEISLNVGDVVLGGRFKNHRIEVKSIGTDELGQPIFNNDRKLLSVRIEKKLPEGMWSSKTLAEKYKDKDMDKKAFLEEVYNSALKDELEKISAEMPDTMSKSQRMSIAKTHDRAGNLGQASYNYNAAFSGRKLSPSDSSRHVSNFNAGPGKAIRRAAGK